MGKKLSEKANPYLRICLNCKNEYLIKNLGQIQLNRKYCSKKCASIQRRIAKILKICLECGSEFFILPCRIKKAQFCSLVCAKIGKVKTRTYTPKGNQIKIEKTCQRCQKIFLYNPAKKNVARYCSKECSKRPREKSICFFCAKEYEYAPRDRHNSIKFCSRDCVAKYHTANSFWKVATDQQIHDYLENLFKTKVKKHENGCWEWLGGRYKAGYGGMIYKGKPAKVHRISYMFYNNDWNIPVSTLICHRCDHPWCFAPKHLFKGTPSDNMQDMLKKGRGNRAYGKNVWNAKINDEIARAVLRLLKRKLPMTEIARKLNISKDVVNSIKRKKSWKHVKI